jgi:four helix bundle suffix protein
MSSIRPSGGYRTLRSFRTATLIYDATVDFCGRFVEKRSRMVDQMVQAARSGRQNIAEGSRASTTSSQTELRLVNVARASLDELLLDFEDFLRQRGLHQWSKESREACAVRCMGSAERDPADRAGRFAPYTRWLEHPEPAVVANTLICLIHQANYLLDRQIAGLERNFVEQGGYSETLAAARIAYRAGSEPTPAQAAPPCPRCSSAMVRRTAQRGPKAGSQFWGCTSYPACKATLPL